MVDAASSVPGMLGRIPRRPAGASMTPLLLAVGLTLAAPPAPAAPADGPALFEKLKTLEGNWKAGEKDATRFVSLRVISNGTAVLEMVTGADRTKVLSAAVYHLDGSKLVLAHYGPSGTPRLEARATGKLEFEGKGASLSLVTLTPKADDKLVHETVGASGKTSLELTREYVDTLK
jgi:hypothetical protein